MIFRGDTSTGPPGDFMEARRPPAISDGEILVEDGMQRRVGAFAATQTASWQASEADDAKITGFRDGRRELLR